MGTLKKRFTLWNSHNFPIGIAIDIHDLNLWYFIMVVCDNVISVHDDAHCVMHVFHLKKVIFTQV